MKICNIFKLKIVNMVRSLQKQLNFGVFFNNGETDTLIKIIL
jgi:hypothetical protein